MSCFVYWIKSEEHSDFESEGYIGISYSPSIRLSQHMAFAKQRKRYCHEMAGALCSGNFELKVLVEASRKYCLWLEGKLRPSMNIGWNRAIGGDGGSVYKHGLTGTLCSGSYYNLKAKARSEGKCFYWKSLPDFLEFYNSVWFNGGMFHLKDEKGEYSPDNLTCVTCSEHLTSARRCYLLGDTLYSVAELAALTGAKPNTVSTRLKRGWSIKEAIYGR